MALKISCWKENPKTTVSCFAEEPRVLNLHLAALRCSSVLLPIGGVACAELALAALRCSSVLLPVGGVACVELALAALRCSSVLLPVGGVARSYVICMHSWRQYVLRIDEVLHLVRYSTRHY